MSHGRTRTAEIGPGQHMAPDSVPGEELLGRSGTSSVQSDGPPTSEPRPAKLEKTYYSLRTEFQELTWHVRPEIEFLDSLYPAKAIGHVMGESCRMDPRGMLLNICLPKVEWLKHLLTQRLVLRISIEMPNLGTKVLTLAKVAWAEAISGVQAVCKLGILFDELDIVDRDRILRYTRQQKVAARGLG